MERKDFIARVQILVGFKNMKLLVSHGFTWPKPIKGLKLFLSFKLIFVSN